MPTTVQFRRGTTAQNDAFTGAAGELSIDTDKNAIRIHDNSTAGGIEIVNVSATQTLTNKTLTSPTINSATIAMGTNKITGMGDPVSAQDAATKAYVDSGLSSLSSTTLTEGNTNVVVADSGTGTVTVTVDGTTHSVLAAAGITLSQGAFVGNLTGNVTGDITGSATLSGVPTAPTAAANTNTTQIATTAYVQTEITDLIGGAPGALDTLNELAAAINDDSSFASSVTTSLGGKVGTSSNQALSTAANVLTNSGATISLARASGDTDSVTLTLADLGYSGATNANYITNNNQLTNGAGYVTSSGVTSVAAGSYLTGGTITSTGTLAVNATSANTGSTVVARDGSGNFSAGVITATTTAARYADLAERYTADADYEPGTVLVFGGEAEVTQATSKYDRRIAGIVSTDPAFLMNESLEDGISVGLVGRLPCKVVGEVRKGDLMVASDTAGHAEAWRDESNPPAGSVIGKALENKTGAGADVIEVVVGKI